MSLDTDSFNFELPEDSIDTIQELNKLSAKNMWGEKDKSDIFRLSSKHMWGEDKPVIGGSKYYTKYLKHKKKYLAAKYGWGESKQLKDIDSWD